MFVLIGAGGHAKVIIDILKANNEDIAGFFDDDPEAKLGDLPLLGNLNDLIQGDDYSNYRFIIAIGNNEIRKRIAFELNNKNYRLGTAIHPTAVIGSEVIVGKGTVIMANCVINHSASLGVHTIINTGATVDHDCVIKDFVHISPGANLAGSVTIGEGTHIGIGSSIIQSITVGENSVIGAGSAVVKDIQANSIAVGCPAKVIKSLK